MELRIVNFEIITRHYKKYQDEIEVIESHKQKYIDLIDPLKKEMQSIILSHQSGLVVDSMTQKERTDRFQKLQEEMMSIDKNATHELTELRDKMTKQIYSDLEVIISDWSKENSIDIVMGKMECVYLNEKYDITDEILDSLKSKSLYVDYVETELNEKESV